MQKSIQTIENLSETQLTLLKLKVHSSYELKISCLWKSMNFYRRNWDPYKNHTTSIKKTLCSHCKTE